MSLFDFGGHQVRVVKIDGEPWFVAKGVCEALGRNRNAQGFVKVNNALVGVSGLEKTFYQIKSKARASCPCHIRSVK